MPSMRQRNEAGQQGILGKKESQGELDLQVRGQNTEGRVGRGVNL